MLKEIYQLIKHALAPLDVELIDYYLDQYNQEGDDAVAASPALYVEIQPIIWQTQLGGVQKATVQFVVHLVTESVYGNDLDIIDPTYARHAQHLSDIYTALHGRSLRLSMLPDYGGPDMVLLEGMVRTESRYHHQLNNLMVSTVTFQARTIDIAATPQYQQVMAALQLVPCFVPKLT